MQPDDVHDISNLYYFILLNELFDIIIGLRH